MPQLPNEEIDARTNNNIGELLPVMQNAARLHVQRTNEKLKEMDKCKKEKRHIKIIMSYRSIKEQDDLYAKGRNGNTEKKVTNVPGGRSYHNYRVAYDIGVFKGKKYIGEDDAYKTAGSIGQAIGLTWGGTFKSIIDEPHFQYPMPLKEIKKKLNEGATDLPNVFNLK